MTYMPSYGDGDFVPTRPAALTSRSLDHLPPDYCPVEIRQAINALTPSLYRAAHECHAIYGAAYGAILANLLGSVSFAVAAKWRIGDGNGRPMPLVLHIRFGGAPMSGKSTAYARFHKPIEKAVKDCKSCRVFNNTTLPALLRKLRTGAVWSRLGTAEGRGHLNSTLSRSDSEMSELYDGNVPSFDRADDDEEISADAADSAIFVVCVNVQDDAHRRWILKYAENAMASGYLFRVLIIETDELANEGAGGQQPEVALVHYDERIGQLIASGRINLETMSASQLPVLETDPEAEQIFRDATRHFEYMASVALPGRNSRVFAVRLIANARRIAGCMHVFEDCDGPVSVDTMKRALLIAEYFGGQWLAAVFPPMPIPEATLHGQHLLQRLYHRQRQSYRQLGSWLKADLLNEAPNFGWTRAQMNEAITWICGQNLAEIVTRRENGRPVVRLELIMRSFTRQLGYRNEPPRLR